MDKEDESRQRTRYVVDNKDRYHETASRPASVDCTGRGVMLARLNGLALIVS